jgi:hypothetical protein
MQSLAEFLGTSPAATETAPRLEDITDSKTFALAVLSSAEFRSYIVNSLTLGSLPAAVITRMMDYAWGKPVDRVEHTGKDGSPIEMITEVRRVIVRVPQETEEMHDEVVH